MAKAQTFSEKLNKKQQEAKSFVKVIKGFTSEIGSTRFVEKVVKIDDLSQLEKLDIN